MKKITILLLATFWMAGISAGPVDFERVTTVAQNWLSHQLALKGQYPDVQVGDHYIHPVGDHVLFYVINFEPRGFVIVAGNDACAPILGYSITGTTSPGAFPPNMVSFFESYEQAILEMHLKDQSCPHTLEIWTRIASNDIPVPKGENYVEPLLHTQWGQGVGWNAFCPEDTLGPGGHALVGCVAIAMGQIAKYWNFPQQGSGAHKYVHHKYGLQQANFAETTYKWQDMPNAMGNPSTAEMLYQMGVSVNMKYGPNESASYSQLVSRAMAGFFGYNPDAEYVLKTDYEYEEWIALLKDHLVNNIPLYYSGRNEEDAGHAFTCDGYDINGLFHFNWGWGGMSDGYFYIDSVNYGVKQGAILNLYPAHIEVPPLGGQGLETAPYRISSLQNLLWMASDPERWGYDYIQTCDIDASATQFWNHGAGWNPIGYFNSETDLKPFTGSYNGNGFKIDSLYINRPQQDYVGLFGYTDGSLIKNLGITNAHITGKDNVGALAGVNYCLAMIDNCYSSGVVNGHECVGGLAGANSVAEISSSYNLALVNGSGISTGGVTGMSVNAEIKESWNGGQVNGYDSSGGLVGVSYTSAILNSYNRGAVTGYESVGGLVGFNMMSDITHSYSTGRVSAQMLAGGLIGEGWDGNIINSYWDTQASNQSLSQGGLGKTTEQMTFPADAHAYVGWDFDQMWSINNVFNEGYPFLQSIRGKYELQLEGEAGDGYVHLHWQWDAWSNEDEGFSDSDYSTHTKDSPAKGSFLGFNIYRNHEVINPEPWLGADYLDSEIVNENSYTYYINMVFENFETHVSNFLVLSPYFPFPRKLEAYAGMGQVALHWEPASCIIDDNELTGNQIIKNDDKESVFLGYNVYRNNLLVNEEPLPDTLFVDMSVTNNDSYGYRVTALYSTGESRFTNLAKATPSMPRPTNLTAVADAASITLHWQAPVMEEKHNIRGILDNKDLIGYNIYRGDFKINDELVTERTFTDTNLQPYRSYFYRIKAVYPSTVSLFSHMAKAVLFSGVEPAYGDGTEQNPYQIATLENLVWIGEDPLRWNYHYVQTENISAFTTRQWFNASGWVTIGNSNHKFLGSYDGQGHFIDALFISGGSNRGLFGVVGERNSEGIARISNLGLTNIDLTGITTLGAIAGYAENALIEHCFSTGQLQGWTNVGGLVGQGGPGLKISFGLNSSKIRKKSEGSLSVGGIIGSVSQGQIYYSINLGEVFGSNLTGGIAGKASDLILTNSFGSGGIEGNNFVGGLIGYTERNCSVTHCYSNAWIQTPESGAIGGLLGTLRPSDVVEYSYWDMEASGQTTSAGGLGRTTEQMTSPYDAETYAFWDFEEIWEGDADHIFNNGYPYLQWQEFYIDPVMWAHGASSEDKGMATVWASIVFTGLSDIVEHGFCWNTTGNPSLEDSHNQLGPATQAGLFSSVLTGLQSETQYYLRAYANNAQGVTYSNELVFFAYEAAAPQYALTITSAGNGWIEVNGQPYTSKLYFEQDASLNLQAIAEEGWKFLYWSGDTEGLGDDQAASTTLVMPGFDIALTAHLEVEVGVVSEESGSFKVYPNPAKGMVTLEMFLTEAHPLTLQLYSAYGELLYQRDISGSGPSVMPLDLKGFPSGMYLLIFSEAKQTKTLKIILGDGGR